MLNSVPDFYWLKSPGAHMQSQKVLQHSFLLEVIHYAVGKMQTSRGSSYRSVRMGVNSLISVAVSWLCLSSDIGWQWCGAEGMYDFGKGMILFPVTAYKPLKLLFDTFHKADTQTISLKQKQ